MRAGSLPALSARSYVAGLVLMVIVLIVVRELDALDPLRFEVALEVTLPLSVAVLLVALLLPLAEGVSGRKVGEEYRGALRTLVVGAFVGLAGILYSAVELDNAIVIVMANLILMLVALALALAKHI